MKEPPASLYLQHILEAIQRIREYTAKGKKVFEANTMQQDAVMKNLEVIGEASRRLPQTLKNQHAKIPWRQIVDTRNFLIHQYEDANVDVLWDVVQDDLPELQKAVKSMLKKIS